MASLSQQLPTDGTVLLRVTHWNLKTFSPDISFSLQASVKSVKEKLQKECGTSVGSMGLELYDDSGSKASDLGDDSRPLGSSSAVDGYRLHIALYPPLDDGTSTQSKKQKVSQNPSGSRSKIPDNHMEDLAANIKLPTDGSILLQVTHWNLKNFSADMRFSLQASVKSVKEKLQKACGTSVGSMRLELYDDSGSKVCDLSEDSRPLGFYSAVDGYRLHVVLDAPLDGNFGQSKKQKVSRNPSNSRRKIPDNYMEDLAANIKVGDRCEVNPGKKTGRVMYVGKAENLAPGYWVGVMYDFFEGKHAGWVKGMDFFICEDLRGDMKRPDKVTVGDYPDPFEN